MKRWTAILLIASALGPTLHAQTTTKKTANPDLGLVGIVVMATSVGMIVPIAWGDQYEVLDTRYCVESRAIYRGDCQGSTTPTLRKVGYGVLGAGALLTYLGFRSKTITVAPAVSKTGATLTTTIKW
jgi:hypothetical protein